MTRSQKFQDLKSDPWYSKIISKLRPEEMSKITDFIQENETLTLMEWEMKVNRMFMDKVKTRNWTSVMEVLTVTGKV